MVHDSLAGDHNMGIKVDTNENVSDIFTKPLLGERFELLRGMLGVWSPSEAPRAPSSVLLRVFKDGIVAAQASRDVSARARYWQYRLVFIDFGFGGNVLACRSSIRAK